MVEASLNGKIVKLITDVYMVAYARTPMGNFQGTLSSLTTCELGGIAIRGNYRLVLLFVKVF